MIYISSEVYNAIIEAFSIHTPECGGVLGARPESVISEFYFDYDGISTPESYTPNYIKINNLLESEWAEKQIQMVGIVHSHGNSGEFPSCGDLYYCEQIMRSANIDQFILPIITLNPFCFHPYIVELKDNQIKVSKERYEII